MSTSPYDAWSLAAPVLADGAPSGGLVLGVLGVLLVVLLAVVAAIVLGIVFVVKRIRRRAD